MIKVLKPHDSVQTLANIKRAFYRAYEKIQQPVGQLEKVPQPVGQITELCHSDQEEGFAFVGRQYHLTVDGDDYYLDMLFYHLKLRCYVVVELKSTSFKPEFAGKLNFYLSAVDDLLKAPSDAPTIGLLLCSDKKSFTVEYALRDINKPIGVASYEAQLVESLPSNLQGSLPSMEEIEAELTKKESSSESAD